MKHLTPSLSRWSLVALLAVAVSPSPARAQEESPAATRQYAAAAGLQNRKSYDLAAEAWLKFINNFKTDPRVDQANYNLGVCFYLDNKLDLAQTAFEELIKRSPKLEKLDAAYLYLGVTRYSIAKRGKTEAAAAAVQTFDALIAKFPQSQFIPDALYYRGESLYMAGKKQEAAAAYRQLVAKHPNHDFVPEALYAMGVCQQESDQNDEAVKTYDQFLGRFSTHAFAPEVNLRRGETLFTAKRFDTAARSFALAAAAKGYDLADYALVRQADCRLEMNEHVEAARLYQSVPTKFPNSEHGGGATVAAGKCYYLAGNYAQARNTLAQPLKANDPAAYEAAHWIARSYLKEKQPAKALQGLQKILPKAETAKSPMAPQLLMDQADAVYETPDRRKESIALYATLARKHKADPVAPQALYMAAFTALELGDNAAAREHAAAFLAAYPQDGLFADVSHIKAESQLLLRQFPEALAQYDQLLARYPDHPDAELWKVRRGLVFHMQEKHQETVDALAPALAKIRRPELVAEARYLIGVSQIELGRHKEATASLEGSVAAQAKWRQADETLLALARARGQLKDYAGARSAVNKLIVEFPQSKVLDKAHYRLGEYAYLAGDFAAAAAAYRKVTTGWPKSPLAAYALHELGCVQMDADDNAGSEQSLTSFLQQHPDHELANTARFSRGMARHRLGKFAPAVEDLQAFLATNPPAGEKSNARYLLGLCQMALDQHAPAIATFQALLKDEPEYQNADNALYQLAWAQKLSGAEAEAAASFEQLAEKHPDSKRAAEAHYHVGEFRYKQQEYKEAAVAYFRAMKKAGKSELDEKAAHKLAWSYYHRDEFAKANQTFSYQRLTYPEGALAADAAFMQAECLFKQDKFAEALAAFEPEVKLSSPDFQILRLLHAGQAAAQLKQWDKSLQFLKQCTDKFPDSPYAPEAFYEQGWARQNLGAFDEAVQLYQRVISLTDVEIAARAQFMIGEVQFEQKDHKEAIKSYFKVMYGYSFPTWQAEATFEAARCFEVLKKVDQALDLYRELVEKFPDSSRVALAKERIEKLAS